MITLEKLEEICGCPLEVSAEFYPDNPEKSYDNEIKTERNKQPAGFAIKETKE